MAWPKGKPRSPETLRKMRKHQFQKGNTIRKNTQLSPETKHKMSISHKSSAKVRAHLKALNSLPEHLVRGGARLSAWNKSPEGKKHRELVLSSATIRAKISQGVSKAMVEGRHHPSTNKWGISGRFLSNKNKRKFYTRSKLERECCRKLEANPRVKRYLYEPCAIPYDWEGKSRHYIPDLLVYYTDKTCELLEVKPKSKALRYSARNKAKYKAAKKWCQKRRVPTIFRTVGPEDLKQEE